MGTEHLRFLLLAGLLKKEKREQGPALRTEFSTGLIIPGNKGKSRGILSCEWRLLDGWGRLRVPRSETTIIVKNSRQVSESFPSVPRFTEARGGRAVLGQKVEGTVTNDRESVLSRCRLPTLRSLLGSVLRIRVHPFACSEQLAPIRWNEGAVPQLASDCKLDRVLLLL
jgi:hypothetical protein